MRLHRTLLQTLVASAFLLAAACQGGDVTAPAAAPAPAASPLVAPSGAALLALTEAEGAHPHAPATSARLVACSAHVPVAGSNVVGPRGGTIWIGGSRLIVPAGALRDTVTITGTARGDGTSTIDFKPKGLHFLKPALLAFEGAECTFPGGAVPYVAYMGEGNTVLEHIAAVYVPRWKIVAAPIEHFCGYAIAF